MCNSHMPAIGESAMLKVSSANLQEQISKGSPFKCYAIDSFLKCSHLNVLCQREF